MKNRYAHTPTKSIYELKKEMHNSLGQLEEAVLPPLHHSPSFFNQPGGQLNDDTYYYR